MTQQTHNQFSLVHSNGRSGANIPNTVSWDVQSDLAERIVRSARMIRQFPHHSMVFTGPESDWLVTPKEPPIQVRQVEVAVTAREYWLEAILDDGSVVRSSHVSVLETAETFGLLVDGLEQAEQKRPPQRHFDDRRRRVDVRPDRKHSDNRKQTGSRHHRRSDRHSNRQHHAAHH